jgi:hypothetical protein
MWYGIKNGKVLINHVIDIIINIKIVMITKFTSFVIILFIIGYFKKKCLNNTLRYDDFLLNKFYFYFYNY